MPRRIRKFPPVSRKESTHDETGDTIPGQELLDALARLRFDSKYSDLTILCGHESYAVHRCIVCTRSGFFAKACDGNFTEASTHTVTLHEEPALVKRMIEYFYTLDYQIDPSAPASDGCVLDKDVIVKPSEFRVPSNDEQTSPDRPESEGLLDDSNQPFAPSEPSEKATPTFDPLSFHILMYSLADRMFIQGLKALSQQNVERELVQKLDASSFPQAILEIYNSTPTNDRGLRDLAVKITMDHLTALRNEGESAPAAFQDSLLQSVPQFSYDLLVASLNKSVSIWNRNDTCRKNWSTNW